MKFWKTHELAKELLKMPDNYIFIDTDELCELKFDIEESYTEQEELNFFYRSNLPDELYEHYKLNGDLIFPENKIPINIIYTKNSMLYEREQQY